jgi:F-type H+-transporting ATPase subunit delta
MDKYILAHPYAKAVFDTAVESNTLRQWSQVLASLSMISKEKFFTAFITNQSLSLKQRGNLLADVAEKFLGKSGRNFIQVLVENQRLNIFPELAVIYEQLHNEYRNIVSVKAISAYALTSEQQINLETALQKRLQKRIIIKYTIDEKLLGGMAIYIGDHIIDGSLLNKLNKLKKDLLP